MMQRDLQSLQSLQSPRLHKFNRCKDDNGLWMRIMSAGLIFSIIILSIIREVRPAAVCPVTVSVPWRGKEIMTIKHLKIFLTVCEEESVTCAAKKLFMSQPAVSLALKEMEKHYGVKLFERFARKLVITEAGKDLYGYASHIISLYDEMEGEIKAFNGAGRLRIGSSITIGTCLMPGYIKKFKEEHPYMNPYVKIDSSDVIENCILENKLDLAVIEGNVHSDSIYEEKLLTDRLVVICSMKNPLRNRREVFLEDLKEENFLLREKNSGTRELVDSAFLTHDFTIEPVWESTSTEALIHAVVMNHGISVLPYRLIMNRISKQKVAVLPMKDISFERCFSIVYHKNKFLTQAAKEFIGMVREEMGKLK